MLILLAIGAFLWQRSTSRRVAEIIAEQEAEKPEQAPPLTVEEQSQMFASEDLMISNQLLACLFRNSTNFFNRI